MSQNKTTSLRESYHIAVDTFKRYGDVCNAYELIDLTFKQQIARCLTTLAELKEAEVG